MKLLPVRRDVEPHTKSTPPPPSRSPSALTLHEEPNALQSRVHILINAQRPLADGLGARSAQWRGTHPTSQWRISSVEASRPVETAQTPRTWLNSTLQIDNKTGHAEPSLVWVGSVDEAAAEHQFRITFQIPYTKRRSTSHSVVRIL